MKKLFYFFPIIVLLFSTCILENLNNRTLTTLRDSFYNPPNEAKVRAYWWWLNSRVTKESITSDLEEMKQKGYGGAIIFDASSSGYWLVNKTPSGPPFGSKEWKSLLAFCVQEADRLDLELSLSISSGWNLGGPQVKPEDAMKKLVFSETTVEGPAFFSDTLAHPQWQIFYKDIAVQAIRKKEHFADILQWPYKSFNQTLGWKGIYPLHILRENRAENNQDGYISADSIVNLNNEIKDGILNWEIPQGQWILIRYGMSGTGAKTSTNSDGAGGLSLDHLSKKAFSSYFEEVVVPLIKSAQEAGTSLKYLYTDSWEMGNANWTQEFEQFFKQKRSYEITPYLPVLTNKVVINREVSNRFLFDYRKTVSDAIIENHYQYFKELAAQYGLGIHPESGGPHSAPIDAIKTMSNNDFPMGEFWARSNTHRIKDEERLSVKQGASVAHVYGTTLMAAEGPTSIGPHWERSPKDLKSVIDRVFCSGVNRIVWHTFTNSPAEFGKPGHEYFAGTHLNPNVTWWNEALPFIEYINRSSYLLSRGLFVADLLIYYGDDTPNYVFLREEVQGLPFGYDWDKCDAQAILQRCSISDGKIVLPDGMFYRLLVLPDQKSINLQVLEKIEKLVKAGMKLYGPKPESATGLTGYPDSDEKIKVIADRLWGKENELYDNFIGRGRVLWGMSLADALQRLDIDPDFSFTSNNTNTELNYIHRRTKSEEIYYVVNPYAYQDFFNTAYQYRTDIPNNYETFTASFRVTGLLPEIWDPVRGKMFVVDQFNDKDGRIFFDLELEPEGGVFVIFREKNEKEPEKTIADYNKILADSAKKFTIDSPWALKFVDGYNAPDSLNISSLQSWTEFEDVNVKYYSGHAVYENFVHFDQELNGKTVLLDLGSVLELAQIFVNDYNLGIVWKAPFRVDVTEALKPGVNRLQIKVVNLWCNRLILDGMLPIEQRITRTNVIKFEKNGEQYLRKSGLLGPVQFIFVNK